jgi:predicted metal-dependent hydrolase
VSKKSEKIAAFIVRFEGKGLDPHYLAYFDCFNRQLFYEAHDVLEDLWLARRHQPEDLFYKGLIQLAGAFVHLQKNRLRPAAALFKLTHTNLSKYSPNYYQLDVLAVLAMVESWLAKLELGAFVANPLTEAVPQVQLMGRTESPSAGE